LENVKVGAEGSALDSEERENENREVEMEEIERNVVSICGYRRCGWWCWCP